MNDMQRYQVLEHYVLKQLRSNMEDDMFQTLLESYFTVIQSNLRLVAARECDA